MNYKYKPKNSRAPVHKRLFKDANRRSMNHLLIESEKAKIDKLQEEKFPYQPNIKASNVSGGAGLLELS